MTPLFRPVGDTGLMVEFGAEIAPDIHAHVLALDGALMAQPFDGFVESVASYASLMVLFDPVRCDHARARAALQALLAHPPATAAPPVERVVEVCYDADLAPDLAAVAEATGLSAEGVIAAHLAGDYRVYMYGFAPGYAYMAGVPPVLHLPRKSVPLRDIPAGSVMIAGPQCLVSTLKMPTGWWLIGRSPTRILTGDAQHPFLFDVGDRVRLKRIPRARYEEAIR